MCNMMSHLGMHCRWNSAAPNWSRPFGLCFIYNILHSVDWDTLALDTDSVVALQKQCLPCLPFKMQWDVMCSQRKTLIETSESILEFPADNKCDCCKQVELLHEWCMRWVHWRNASLVNNLKATNALKAALGAAPKQGVSCMDPKMVLSHLKAPGCAPLHKVAQGKEGTVTRRCCHNV